MYNYHANLLYMSRVNIADARAHLSRYLARVEAGETITLCRRNVPVAEIRPIRTTPAELRPIGIDRGMVIPDSFFAPLPDEVSRAFRGDPDEGGDQERGSAPARGHKTLSTGGE